MPINSITITTTPEEQTKTYFIEYYGKTVFVQTTPEKFNTLIDILGDLEVVEEWGEIKDYNGIYEL